MKNSKTLGRNIFIIILTLSTSGIINAQGKRIFVEFSPLYSYSKISGEYTYNTKGEDTPQFGFGSAIKFEKDINKYLSLSTGISYEYRQNKYSGIVYDTTNFVWIGDPPPYKYNLSSTFKFVGIPISLNVNYLNSPKLIIYQTIGIKANFLLSAEYENEEFYENGTINYRSGNINADKSDFIFVVSSSIGIRKKINDNLFLKIEPGFYYMVNNFLDYGEFKKKFFDLKIDFGISYEL